MVDRAAHRFSYVEYWPPPRCFRRKKSSGFANAGRICEIYILRCRGRCPHRPARNDRFMAVFRRNRVHFLFYAVGADDPVRPQETPVFTEIRCESATFSMGRCRHRPLHPTTKIQRILRADRVVRPYNVEQTSMRTPDVCKYDKFPAHQLTPGGKSKRGGRSPLLGRFKGIAKGEIEIPLCHSFNRQRRFLSHARKKAGLRRLSIGRCPKKTAACAAERSDYESSRHARALCLRLHRR